MPRLHLGALRVLGLRFEASERLRMSGGLSALERLVKWFEV